MTTRVSTEAEAGEYRKDFLSLGELGPEELSSLIDLAETFKEERKIGRFIHQIKGTSLALLFEKPSTRTRVSFEVAMFELGGHAVVLNSRDMQVSRGESLADTAKALSQFCHGIAARVISHETLTNLAENASISVINALSDKYHPCQTLADIQTIKQFKGNLRRVKVAWVGDGNNVCNSLMIGAALSGMQMVIACPSDFRPLDDALSAAQAKSRETGAKIKVVTDPLEAAEGADVIVTDTFVSMGQESEKEKRLREFLPRYQVNAELVSNARPDAIFMHCLPAHRGEEVTSSVIDGPRSVVWQEAENRLHAQKAILYALMKKYSKPAIREKSFL